MIKRLIAKAQSLSIIIALSACLLPLAFTSCERQPPLHLHDESDSIIVEFPIIDLDLKTYWDYEFLYGIVYDWKSEWYYGWDEEDERIFGPIGYTEPDVFNVRRYFTAETPYAPHTNVKAHQVKGNSLRTSYEWGFWDILVWNDIMTPDGIQSLVIDENESLDYVTARTNETMKTAAYDAPIRKRSYYQPEELFSAYEQGIDINKDMRGFEYDPERNVWVRTLNMTLMPVTYIYLTQVILHHNNGKITGVDGSANLSGMAWKANINNGVTYPDPVTVNYNVRFKNHCDMKGEDVDIAGGRLLTFGLCNFNARTVQSEADIMDDHLHYMDLTMQFNNGRDSTFVFDVTKQVRKRFKGGVLTVELDMDTIPVPRRNGGSAFDAVVKDFEDGGTHEFEM